MTTVPIDYARRHARIGWWSLLVFAALGLMLESFHGFKVAAYLDVSNETRRFMWRLAHAHGTLLAVVHILFGLSVGASGGTGFRHEAAISLTLTGAGFLLPLGFFLGGFGFYGGDPGLGILLVPVGAVLLLAALGLAALSTRTDSPGSADPRPERRSRGR